MILLGLSHPAGWPSTGQDGDFADRGADRMPRPQGGRRSGGSHGRQDYPFPFSLMGAAATSSPAIYGT
jgi:hypothetical protein